jgi:hypothetical protein
MREVLQSNGASSAGGARSWWSGIRWFATKNVLSGPLLVLAILIFGGIGFFGGFAGVPSYILFNIGCNCGIVHP